MKNKKWMLILVSVTIVIMVVIISVCIYERDINRTENKSNKINDINIISLNKFELKERTTLTKDNVIYIGENNKELQNGFYDLKIVIKINEIKVYLNKLWYKECNESYMEEQYLAKICRELVNNLEFSKTKELANNEDLEYVLYKYIKDNYVIVRQGKPAQRIETNNISIKLEYVDTIPVLIIRGV